MNINRFHRMVNRLLCAIVLVCLFALNTGIVPAAKAQGELPIIGGGGAIDARVNANSLLPLTSTYFNYQYLLLKLAVAVQADGRGDVIVQMNLRNTDTVNGNDFTWYFDWPSGQYSNIRAWDANGPLVFSTSQTGTRIFVTVNFRQPLQPNNSYEFSFATTIGGMASGSGNNWNASWYWSPGSPVQQYIQDVTFPSNSTIQNISPAPATQSFNRLEWKYSNTPANWTHTINVAYTLSDSINVTLFLQRAPATWAGDTYGNYPSGDTVNTISRWGCTMTSAAMIVEYWGQKSSPTFHTDPGALNAWLRTHNGYDKSNGVIHSAVAKYATDNHVTLYFHRIVNGKDDAILDDYLRSGNPVILKVKNSLNGDHFVLATGKITEAGQSTYSINDPFYGATTLLDKYNNTYSAITLYSNTPADTRVLRLSAHSPVELLVTDPLGRKSGFDPTTNTTWDEIPNTIYTIDSLAPDDGSNTPVLEDKYLEMIAPLDGNYTVNVMGTGQGLYEIDTFASDWFGDVSKKVNTGLADVGSNDTVSVSFSSYSGVRVFADVSDAYWAMNFVERLYAAGITGGCGTNPLQYCPDSQVTRAQMAVFLERGIHGSLYAPPGVGATTGFNDVPTSYWSAAWIKQLAADGITGGCGAGNYCPDNAVTRAQMAVFLLKSKYGPSYTPPSVGTSTGFNDVPTNYWSAAWIKQLAAEGITGGCGTNLYCPESAVTRAQMAVFLVRTFNLP